jgi:hypothetical protein
MRVFLISCLSALVLAIGGLMLLSSLQKPAGVAYATDGARISPGWSWRQVVSRLKGSPTNKSMSLPGGDEAMAEGCDVSSTWSYILVDFRDSATADPTCDH